MSLKEFFIYRKNLHFDDEGKYVALSNFNSVKTGLMGGLELCSEEGNL